MTAKHRERVAQLARRKQEVEARHDDELERAAAEHRGLHGTNRLRKASRTNYIVCTRLDTRSARGETPTLAPPLCTSAGGNNYENIAVACDVKRFPLPTAVR